MQTNKNYKKNFVRKNNEVKTTKSNVKKDPEDGITLVIIDKQFDFDDPAGALYVSGGENLNGPIIKFVNTNRKKVNQIIFTRDWHTKKDKSFKNNGGIWPDHCVQGTPGAEINKELYDTLFKTGIPVTIVNKGTVYDHEEYGAFEHCATFHHLHPNDKPSVKNVYFANYESSSGTRILNENVVICGIAGDYCVKESIKNLLMHWRHFKISVLMDGTASIDGGTALNELIEEKNLKKI